MEVERLLAKNVAKNLGLASCFLLLFPRGKPIGAQPRRCYTNPRFIFIGEWWFWLIRSKTETDSDPVICQTNIAVSHPQVNQASPYPVHPSALSFRARKTSPNWFERRKNQIVFRNEETRFNRIEKHLIFSPNVSVNLNFWRIQSFPESRNKTLKFSGICFANGCQGHTGLAQEFTPPREKI